HATGPTAQRAAAQLSGGRQAFTDPIGPVCSPCWLAGPRHLTITSPKIPCSCPCPAITASRSLTGRVPQAAASPPRAAGGVVAGGGGGRVDHAIPHQLRHIYATARFNASVSPESLMALPGHVSAEMTLRYGGSSTHRARRVGRGA